MPLHDPNTIGHLLAVAAAVVPLRPLHMPTHHPRIAHLMRGAFPYLFSDSLAATKLARVLRYPWVDKNAQADREGTVWIVHWADLWKAGYRWRWTGQYRRTRRGQRVEVRERIPESDRHLLMIYQCNTLTVSRLRSAKRGGTRPYTAREHMEACVRQGRRLALEAKGTVNQLRHYVQLAQDSAETGCVLAIMTLTSIGGWRRRVTYALEANHAVAVLPRGPKPADWHEYAARGVQVWGHWRRK